MRMDRILPRAFENAVRRAYDATPADCSSWELHGVCSSPKRKQHKQRSAASRTHGLPLKEHLHPRGGGGGRTEQPAQLGTTPPCVAARGIAQCTAQHKHTQTYTQYTEAAGLAAVRCVPGVAEGSVCRADSSDASALVPAEGISHHVSDGFRCPFRRVVHTGDGQKQVQGIRAARLQTERCSLHIRAAVTECVCGELGWESSRRQKWWPLGRPCMASSTAGDPVVAAVAAERKRSQK